MKTLILAAAAVFAMPALAQTQSGTSMPDSATPAQSTTPAPATPADSSMPAGSTMQAPATGDPVGGYQPSGPAMTGTMSPGVTPIFRAAPSPSEAYPAPAPLASYPVCRPGQFDKCIQGPRSTHSRQVRGRHS